MKKYSLFNPLLSINVLIQNWDLLVQLTKRNIAMRYRGSALGLFWSFAQPLMMLGVYSFVFGIVFKARWGEGIETGGAAFPVIMFCGMAVFNIFSESVNNCTSVIVGNPSYVKKVIFPLEILPLTVVAASFIFGLAWFFMLLLGVAFFMGHISWTMILFPITFIPLLLLTAGVSYFVASLGVYLRDIQQVVAIITQILFFMTPIFYPISIVPEKIRWVLEYNPLSSLVEQTRIIFLYGRQPDWLICSIIFLASYLVFLIGFAWFSKKKKGFADVI